jgi:hypothetical protein
MIRAVAWCVSELGHRRIGAIEIFAPRPHQRSLSLSPAGDALRRSGARGRRRSACPRLSRRAPGERSCPRRPTRQGKMDVPDGREATAFPITGGPRVRIPLAPPVSLSHQCLSWLQAQRPGFRRECEPGRDQRTGRAGHEPARLGCFSLTGIDAVPPWKITARNEKSPGLGLDPLCRGSFFSSPGDDADRSSRAADRVR